MRPGLRNISSGSVNHTDINAFRRWTFEAYGLTSVQLGPNAASPTTKVDIDIHLAALRSNGGELAVKASTGPPAVNLTLDTSVVGAGGLDYGDLSSGSLYAVWLLGKTSSENGIASTVSAIASTNWERPSIPASYTHRRLCGAFATESGSAAAAIIPFTQRGSDYLYHVPQEAINTTSSESIDRTSLSLEDSVPGVCEEVLLDCTCSGGNAPITFKLYEHSTGEEIINLSPATGDFSHEARWVYAPDRLIDYSLSLTNSATIIVNVLGFRLPIGQEI